MPIYEYHCKSCGETFELLRSISQSDSDVRCEKCGAETVERLMSTFAASVDAGSSSGASTSAGCGSSGFS